MELGAGVSKALLAGAEGTEVLTGLGDDIVVEEEVDTAGLLCEDVSDDSRYKRPSIVMRSMRLSCLRRWGNGYLTFDLLGDTSVGIQDWPLPCNIEVGLNRHSCL